MDGKYGKGEVERAEDQSDLNVASGPSGDVGANYSWCDGGLFSTIPAGRIVTGNPSLASMRTTYALDGPLWTLIRLRISPSRSIVGIDEFALGPLRTRMCRSERFLATFSL
jgi:hypothetical protein